ncbi:MAG: DNA-processing protein DprA [Deltaproteobacteria bacterium]|nr:DNA-processing protein DprA [Deltaproteobacteria bacterium]
MSISRLTETDPDYPGVLRLYLKEDAPLSITALGNRKILGYPKLALFCSGRCPQNLIMQTHALLQNLTESNSTVIGGFHSPVEREGLSTLLRGEGPIVVCPARSLVKMRVPKEWRAALEEGRLLVLSFFPDHRHRSDIQMALRRNRFVAALADRIFMPYAAPGSKTEELCKEIVSWGKTLYTVADNANNNLLTLGAAPVTADQDFWPHPVR